MFILVLMSMLLINEWFEIRGYSLVNNESHFGMMIKYIKDDVKPSLSNVKVLSYFIIAVWIFGGAGVWLPWLSNSDNIIYIPGSNVFTFSLALLGSLLCEKLFFNYKEIKLILKDVKAGRDVGEFLEDYEKGTIISAWGMLFGSVNILLVIISYRYYYNETSFVNVLGLIYTIIFYFCAISKDVESNTSIGGQEAPITNDIEKELQEIKNEPGKGIM